MIWLIAPLALLAVAGLFAAWLQRKRDPWPKPRAAWREMAMRDGFGQHEDESAGS